MPAWPVRIESGGGLACASLLFRSRGELRCAIVAKASFALVPGADAALVEPDAIITAEIHHRNNPTWSARLTSDLAPYLPQADVLFTGHAHAPAGRPISSQSVRLAVYTPAERLVDKTLVVRGDWKDGAPQPFQSIPILYERAYGGMGNADNPVGVGYPPGPSAKAPNIVDPRDASRPAGFGPISKAWPRRRALLGKVDRKALEQPTPEIPEGFDWSYYQAAPPDQRAPALRGGEWVLLEGLHPDFARLVSRLPDVRVVAKVYGLDPSADSEFASIDMSIDTLRVDGDAGRCSLTLRATFPVQSEARAAAIRIVASLVVAGAEIHGGASGQGIDESALVDEPTTLMASEPRARAADSDEPAFSGTVALSPQDSARAASAPATPFSKSRAASRVEPAPAPKPAAAPAPASVPSPPPPVAPAPPVVFAPSPPPPVAPAPPVVFAPVPAAAPASVSVPAPVAAPIAASIAARAPVVEPVSATVLAANPTPLRAPAPAASAASAVSVPPRKSDAIPVVTEAPLSVTTIPWAVSPGRPARTVVIKGTFTIAPGGRAARGEADLLRGDVHYGDDPARSVLYPSDFALFKPKADVTLRGHAYAPQRSASEVKFRFGRGTKGFERRITVFGDRRWLSALMKLSPSDPEPFKKMPLLYEHAFGGPGVDANPVGRGSRSALLPNLEDPTHLIESPEDSPNPVGFGPIPMVWPARWSRLGVFGADWHKARWPSFPAEFDSTFFQAAPAAQQLDEIRGDEPFELVGMHPTIPVIEGRLPHKRARCYLQKTGRAFVEIILRLDSVHFDVDEMKLSLVWRGVVEVADDDASDAAELFVTLDELDGPPVSLDEVHARYLAAKGGRAFFEAGLSAEPARDEAAIDEGASSVESAPVKREYLPPERCPLRKEMQSLLAAGAPIDGKNFEGAELSDLDFSARSLAGAALRGARLCRCRFVDADLSGAQMSESDLTDAALDGANLNYADLHGATLDGASLKRASVESTSFQSAAGARADLRDARGEGASFAEGRWTGARFDKAELPGADFTAADIDEAGFDGAVMPNVKLYDARGARSSFKGATLTEARADGVSLAGASLQGVKAASSVWDGASLDGASFIGAGLASSSFVKASCERALFSGADIASGRLGRARLSGASFLKANLMEASFEAADLSGADLRGANLHGAEVWKASARGANFDLAILTQTKWKERT